MYGNEDERFAMEVCPEEDNDASIEFYPHPNITLVRGASVSMYDLNFDREEEDDMEISGYLSHVVEDIRFHVVEDDEDEEDIRLHSVEDIRLHPNITIRRGRNRVMSISELDIEEQPTTTRHVNIIEDFDDEAEDM
jgi:hypothetical protein